jgi:hypothetical protein
MNDNELERMWHPRIIFDGRKEYRKPLQFSISIDHSLKESNIFKDNYKSYILRQVEIKFPMDSGYEYLQIHQRMSAAVFEFIRKNDIWEGAARILHVNHNGSVVLECYVAEDVK